jgi:holo-[acyl-carrier protein] synthase
MTTMRDPIRDAIAEEIQARGGKHQPIEREAGVANQTLARMLAGANAGIDTVYRICTALGLTIEVKRRRRRRPSGAYQWARSRIGWPTSPMNIIAHGIDLCDCKRIAELLERHGPRFRERLLTSAERDRADQFRDPTQHIAGRFAAKEAVLKVLGTGWRGGIAWTDVEIINQASGQPVVHLHNQCKEIADRLGIKTILISITHTPDTASASAIALGN